MPQHSGLFRSVPGIGMDEPPKGLRTVKVTDKGEVLVIMIRSTLFHLYIVLDLDAFNHLIVQIVRMGECYFSQNHHGFNELFTPTRYHLPISSIYFQLLTNSFFIVSNCVEHMFINSCFDCSLNRWDKGSI